jgi:hypothetical protein
VELECEKGVRRTFFYHGVKIIVLGWFFVSLALLMSFYKTFEPGEKIAVTLAGIFWVLAIGVIIFRRRLTMLVMETIWPSARCGKCGEEIELYGVWKCSCGYTDEGYYYKKCSNCKQYIGGGLLDCPSCGMSIKM